jgi:dTDP-4-amino-4,6-dideoxygalactose transaminase
MKPHTIVPFLDLKTATISKKDAYLKAFSDMLDNCDFINGSSVREFEKKFADYITTKYAFGVGNGTDAIEIAIQACGIGPGDEVITQANTFISTVFGISNNGATPILVDCDNQTGMMKWTQLESKITPNTKAIIPVHLRGVCAEMDEIIKIANKYNLVIIEDAAQAHGALYKGRRAGSIGNIGCFSFYPGKNLGAFGDGGAIVTNDDILARNIDSIKNLGALQKYNHITRGRNSRLDTIQASVLNIKLKCLDDGNEMRRQVAAWYDVYLEPIIKVYPKAITKMQISDDCVPVHHLYVVKVYNERGRPDFMKYLNENGVECGIHYPVPIHKSGAYKHIFEYETYENTEDYSEHAVSLPMFPEMTVNHVIKVCDTIRNYFDTK